MPLTLAHLSDVHLAPVVGLGPRHINPKRALGLANWLLKRRKVHLRGAVDALVADLRRQHVDHIIVSGDLVNLGLPGEHAAARSWLEALGPPDRVTVVPGNHDIYCRLWRDPGVERWRAFLGPSEFRVGVAWQGNPASEVASLRGRSMPLRELGQIASIAILHSPNLRQRSLDAIGFRSRRSASSRTLHSITAMDRDKVAMPYTLAG